ncbi:hypothetical protein HDU76_003216 [Blyttiomyces sp. JEL0837]|nr:hypothetical protein HDU76_003216 [Blyttiomyces sp. JEL0837]
MSASDDSPIAVFKRLASNLERLPVHQINSTPETPRRASVAAILRFKPSSNTSSSSSESTSTSSIDNYESLLSQPWVQQSQNLELLHARRSLNPRDLWSGHMAFPGGKVEEGETDAEGAIRETMEEIGLDLTKGFLYLGALDDRKVRNPAGRWIMTLCCHVWIQTTPTTPPVTLEVDEIASVHWTSLNHFIPNRTFLPTEWNPIPLPIQFFNPRKQSNRAVVSAWNKSLAKDSQRLLLGNVVYHGLILPGSQQDDWPTLRDNINKIHQHEGIAVEEGVGDRSDSVTAAKTKPADALDKTTSVLLHPSQSTATRQLLWGLTLMLTSDLVDLTYPPFSRSLPPRSLAMVKPPTFSHLDMRTVFFLASGGIGRWLTDTGLTRPMRKPAVSKTVSSSLISNHVARTLTLALCIVGRAAAFFRLAKLVVNGLQRKR